MEGITIYAVVKSNRENYKTEEIDTTLYTSEASAHKAALDASRMEKEPAKYRYEVWPYRLKN